MKKALIGLVIVTAAGAGVWAWVNRLNEAPTTSGEPQHLLTGTRQDNHDYKYTESSNVYTVEAAYPDRVPLPTAAASAKAQMTLERGLAETIMQFKQDNQFESFTAEDIQIQGIGPDRKYALNLEYKDFDAPGYHSYVYTVYVDTLGAHPNGYYLTFVFDAEGNQIMLPDLFRTDRNWLEELSLLVSNDVVAQLKSRLGENLPQGLEGPDVSGSVYPEGLAAKVENFQNFGLDGDTLVIYIPPYQVAAYAAGSFEVRIPLASLGDILK